MSSGLLSNNLRIMSYNIYFYNDFMYLANFGNIHSILQIDLTGNTTILHEFQRTKFIFDFIIDTYGTFYFRTDNFSINIANYPNIKVRSKL